MANRLGVKIHDLEQALAGAVNANLVAAKVAARLELRGDDAVPPDAAA